MKLPTASHLNRVMLCPASWLLPQVRTASSAAAVRGIEVAAFLEAVQGGTPPARALEVHVKSDEGRRFAEALDLSTLPAGMVGSFAAEVSFAWNPETDNAASRPGLERENIEGWYTGRADVVGVNPLEGLGYVADYKTGRDFVPAADDWQLRMLALALARVYGLDTVHVEKIWLRETGDNPKPSRAEFDSFALAEFASSLRNLAHQLGRAVDKSKLVPVLGDHCRFCPALPACPGQTGLLHSVVRKGDFITSEEGAVITAQQVAELWPKLKLAKRALEEVEKRMKAFAEAEPVDLGDGRMLGPKTTIDETYDGDIAYGILAATIGPEAAERACPTIARKGLIEEELRTWWKAKCEAVAALDKDAKRPLLKDVLNEFRGALLAADGVKIETSLEVGEYKKK